MFLHGIVGIVLIVIALLGIGESLGPGLNGRSRLALPATSFVGGLFIFLTVAIQHLTSHSPGQSEIADIGHWLIGGALVVAGLLVGISRRSSGDPTAMEMAAPFASIAIAGMFFVHSQQDALDLTLHASIAGSLVLSGSAHIASILSGEQTRGLRIFAALLLTIAGMQLVLYDAHFGNKQSAAETEQEH